MRAEEWYEEQCIEQEEYYNNKKKAKRITIPVENLFISKEEYEKSLLMRVKLCDKTDHIGVRLMIVNDENFFLDKKGNPTHCKSCKTQRSKDERAKNIRDSTKVYTDANEWFQENAHKTTEDGLSIGSCRHPKRIEFDSDDTFDQACKLQEERLKQYHKEYSSRTECRNAENEHKRQQYKELKNTEEGLQELKRKQERDDANKRVRRDKAIENGQAWCVFGSHVVEIEDVTFNPHDDLGLHFFGAKDTKQRSVCKHHYIRHLLSNKESKTKCSILPRVRLEWAKGSAKKRNIPWELSTGKIEEVMSAQHCFYCDTSPELFLGFDRIDPEMGYQDNNVVPACVECNMAKGGLHIKEFIQVCTNINQFQTNGIRTIEYIPYKLHHRNSDGEVNTATYINAMPYYKYKYNANKRYIKWNLTKEEFECKTAKGCTYCGMETSQHIGIDRIDSDKGYNNENTQGCCSTCNFLKRKSSHYQFINMCKLVSNKLERHLV